MLLTPATANSLAILLSVLLVALDQTIVATAMPRLVEDLHATDSYSWVTTAYLLGCSVATPIAGRLVDLYPPRRILLASFYLFLGGSLWCALSTSMNSLTLARAVEGLGGGGMLSVVNALVGLLYVPRDRGEIMAYRNAVYGLASVAGPVVGGVLTDQLSWRWVFGLNLPLGLVAVAFITRYLPEQRPQGSGRFDALGALLLAAWTVPLLLGLSLGGSWNGARTLALGLLFALFLLAFLARMRASRSPLFDLSLLRLPAFLWASLAVALAGSCFIGGTTYIPLALIQVLGLSATAAGAAMGSMGLTVPLGSLFAGRYMKIRGRCKVLLLGGNLVAALALAGLAWHTVPGRLLFFLPFLPVLGLAFGVILPLYPVVVQNEVEPARLGVASSGNLFARQVGSTLGTALLGTVLALSLSSVLRMQLPSALERLGVEIPINRFEEKDRMKDLSHDLFGQVDRDVDRALAGDPEALQTLRSSGLFPPELWARVEATPPDRRPGLEPDFDRTWQSRASQAAAEVDSAMRRTMATSVRRVLFVASLFALLALLFTLPLPDRQLAGTRPTS